MTPIYYDNPLVCAGANGWVIVEDFVSISGVGATGWTVAPTGAARSQEVSTTSASRVFWAALSTSTIFT